MLSKQRRALIWLCYIFSLINALHVSLLQTRSHFLQATFSSAWWFQSSVPLPQSSSSSLELPLRFLPVAGCLAIRLNLQGSYRYYAVLDTGSPFLTASEEAIGLTSHTDFADTYEQYGEATGGVKWRRSKVEIEFIKQGLVMGVVPSNLVEKTGGLFFGLIRFDDTRPTILEQLGYQSFVLDYPRSSLQLNRHSILRAVPYTLPLYDLSPHGPNLHHYAVECTSVTLETSPKGVLHLTKLSRPVIVVIDTGLTGCILSDSWRDDLPVPVAEIVGAELVVGGGTERHSRREAILRSDPSYWHVSCFNLPWFSSPDNHPHIIAAGATFLQHSRLFVDTVSRSIKIEKLEGYSIEPNEFRPIHERSES